MAQNIAMIQQASLQVKSEAQAEAARIVQNAQASAHVQADNLQAEIANLTQIKDQLKEEVNVLRNSLIADLDRELESLKRGTWGGVSLADNLIVNQQPTATTQQVSQVPELDPTVSPEAFIAAVEATMQPAQQMVANGDVVPNQGDAQPHYDTVVHFPMD
jgi:hypothetical protein